MIEVFKEDINNSLEIQETSALRVILKTSLRGNKYLKEIQENTLKQVKELNKMVQDLKMEIETIKKSQMEATLETENLGKRLGAIVASITNRIQ
jgi:hypothetical protein